MAVRRDWPQRSWAPVSSAPLAIDTCLESATDACSSQPDLQHNIAQIRSVVGAIRPEYLKSIFVEGGLVRLQHYALHYPRTFQDVINEALKEAGLETIPRLFAGRQSHTNCAADPQRWKDFIGTDHKPVKAHGAELTPLSTLTPSSGESESEEAESLKSPTMQYQMSERLFCGRGVTSVANISKQIKKQPDELSPEHSLYTLGTLENLKSNERLRSSVASKFQPIGQSSMSVGIRQTAANVVGARQFRAFQTTEDGDDEKLSLLGDASVSSSEDMVIDSCGPSSCSNALYRPSHAGSIQQELAECKIRPQHHTLRFLSYEPDVSTPSTYQLCFPCPDLCPDHFTSRAELKKHVRAEHEQVERWSCSHCTNWVSFRPGQFTRHHLKHRCQYESKSQRSTDHPCLQPHSCNSNCSGHRPALPPRRRWACCVCDQVFLDSGSWLTHFIAHFGDSPNDPPRPSFDLLMQNLVRHSPFVQCLTRAQIQALRFQHNRDTMFLQRVLETDLFCSADWKYPVEWTKDAELTKHILRLILQQGQFESLQAPITPTASESSCASHTGAACSHLGQSYNSETYSVQPERFACTDLSSQGSQVPLSPQGILLYSEGAPRRDYMGIASAQEHEDNNIIQRSSSVLAPRTLKYQRSWLDG